MGLKETIQTLDRHSIEVGDMGYVTGLEIAPGRNLAGEEAGFTTSSPWTRPWPRSIAAIGRSGSQRTAPPPCCRPPRLQSSSSEASSNSRPCSSSRLIAPQRGQRQTPSSASKGDPQGAH